MADLTGKVALVTGAKYVFSSPAPYRHCFDLPYSSSPGGIGFNIAQQLSNEGAKVYIAGRSEARIAAAIERLHAEGLEPGNGAIESLQLDLADPRGVKESADKFAARESRLDVLGAYYLILLWRRSARLTTWGQFTMPGCE